MSYFPQITPFFSNSYQPSSSNQLLPLEGIFYRHTNDNYETFCLPVFRDNETNQHFCFDADDENTPIPIDPDSKLYRVTNEGDLIALQPQRQYQAASNRPFNHMTPNPNAIETAKKIDHLNRSPFVPKPLSKEKEKEEEGSSPQRAPTPPPSSSSSSSSSSQSSPQRDGGIDSTLAFNSLHPVGVSSAPSSPLPAPAPISAPRTDLTKKEVERLKSASFSEDEKAMLEKAKYFVKHPNRMTLNWQEAQDLLNNLLALQHQTKKAPAPSDLTGKKEAEKILAALSSLVSIFRKAAEDQAAKSKKPLVIFAPKLDSEIKLPKFSEKTLPADIEKAQREKKLIKDLRNELHSMWKHRQTYDEICEVLENDADLGGKKFFATNPAHLKARSKTYKALDQLTQPLHRSTLNDELSFEECQGHLNQAIRLHRELKSSQPSSIEAKRERDDLTTRLLEFHQKVAEYAISCGNEDSSLRIGDMNADFVPIQDKAEPEVLREKGLALLQGLRKKDDQMWVPSVFSFAIIPNATHEKETISHRDPTKLDQTVKALNARPNREKIEREIVIQDKEGATKKVKGYDSLDESPIVSKDRLKYWSFLDFNQPLSACVQKFNEAVLIYRQLAAKSAITDDDRKDFFETLQVFQEEIKCRAIAENACISLDSFSIDSEDLANPMVRLPEKSSWFGLGKRFTKFGYNLQDYYASTSESVSQGTKVTLETTKKAAGYASVVVTYKILETARDLLLRGYVQSPSDITTTNFVNAPNGSLTIPANPLLLEGNGTATGWTPELLSSFANQVAAAGGWAPEMVTAILILYMAAPEQSSFRTVLKTTFATTAALTAVGMGVYYGTPYLAAMGSNLLDMGVSAWSNYVVPTATHTISTYAPDPEMAALAGSLVAPPAAAWIRARRDHKPVLQDEDSMPVNPNADSSPQGSSSSSSSSASVIPPSQAPVSPANSDQGKVEKEKEEDVPVSPVPKDDVSDRNALNSSDRLDPVAAAALDLIEIDPRKIDQLFDNSESGASSSLPPSPPSDQPAATPSWFSSSLGAAASFTSSGLTLGKTMFSSGMESIHRMIARPNADSSSQGSSSSSSSSSDSSVIPPSQALNSSLNSDQEKVEKAKEKEKEEEDLFVSQSLSSEEKKPPLPGKGTSRSAKKRRKAKQNTLGSALFSSGMSLLSSAVTPLEGEGAEESYWL